MRYATRAPSATSIVALLALFVALGGTSAAAVSLALPRNSVGTAQLKSNAVTSAKIATGGVASSDVKNRSLLSSDFAPGQLPTGPAGPAGPAGPSDGYTRQLTGPVPVPLHSEATVASLAIPQAGNYVVLSKALMSGHGTVTCRLEAGSDFDLSQATPAASSNQTIENVVSHVFAASGSADMKCSGDGDAAASFVKIVAIKVGSLTTASG
jgi:hypothetical protein